MTYTDVTPPSPTYPGKDADRSAAVRVKILDRLRELRDSVGQLEYLNLEALDRILGALPTDLRDVDQAARGGAEVLPDGAGDAQGLADGSHGDSSGRVNRGARTVSVVTDTLARAEADLVAADGYYARADDCTDVMTRGRLLNAAGRCLQLAKVRGQLAQADALDRIAGVVEGLGGEEVGDLVTTLETDPSSAREGLERIRRGLADGRRRP